MKIFISSVITGFEDFRDTAAEAVRALGYVVIRAEDFAASTKSPQVACLSGVREADLVLLLLGERYGVRQPSGLSATQEEYEEARGKKPLLVFVQETTMEPDQVAFRRSVEAWQGGNLWKGFVSPDDLRARVTEAIHKHTLSLARQPVDEGELARRAGVLLPTSDRSGLASVALAIAWGPKQQVLRPSQLEAPAFSRDLHREARFGEDAILDELAEAKVVLRGDSLLIEQRGRSLRLDELGSVVIGLPAVRDEDRGFRWLVEEDLVDRLDRALRFIGRVTTTIDSTERLTHASIACALLDAGYAGWKTREEQMRQPNSGTMGMADSRIVVSIRPPVRTRESLRHDSRSTAEDLVRLLKRGHSPPR
jgi:Domain of unknown function (DUF4062)